MNICVAHLPVINYKRDRDEISDFFILDMHVKKRKYLVRRFVVDENYNDKFRLDRLKCLTSQTYIF